MTSLHEARRRVAALLARAGVTVSTTGLTDRPAGPTAVLIFDRVLPRQVVSGEGRGHQLTAWIVPAAADPVQADAELDDTTDAVLDVIEGAGDDGYAWTDARWAPFRDLGRAVAITITARPT